MRQNSEKESKEKQDDSLDRLRSKSGVGVLLAVSKEWQIAGSESLSSWMLRVRSIEKSRRTTTATHEQREPSNCEGGALENSRKTATLGTVVFLKRGYETKSEKQNSDIPKRKFPRVRPAGLLRTILPKSGASLRKMWWVIKIAVDVRFFSDWSSDAKIIIDVDSVVEVAEGVVESFVLSLKLFEQSVLGDHHGVDSPQPIRHPGDVASLSLKA